MFPKDKLQEIAASVDIVLNKFEEYEELYSEQINNVHPNYENSARNLIHYLAMRSFNVDLAQEILEEIGLPHSSGSHNNILYGIHSFRAIINGLLGTTIEESGEQFLSNGEVANIQDRNAKAVFGPIKNKRKTAIMVTQPTEAVEKHFVKSILKQGMDCARVNCAHDDEIVWKQIIDNVREADSDCKVMMDLGGPKLRTGKMKPGQKVIHIKPKRNTLGQVVTPARVWLAPYGLNPPEGKEADVIIPANKKMVEENKAWFLYYF